ncbi:MAG TPA: hypothetical protein VI583_10585 [Cyclobacteriaceae bacterium]|nr:hypothetical protein [Cyclobacteriaceae bacterium]
MKTWYGIIILAFVAWPVRISAQFTGITSPAFDSLKSSTPGFFFGSQYNSKVNFWGRNLGMEQFSVDPYIMLNYGNGFYFYAVTLLWSEMEEIPVETDIGLGFEHQVTPWFYLSIGYERWFVHSKDVYSRKSLENYFEGVLNYNFKLFQLESGSYFIFGIDRLFVQDFTIAKNIFLSRFMRNGRIEINPGVSVSLSNDSLRSIFGDPVDATTEDFDQRLRIADYEIGIPATLSIGNLELQLIAFYNIPANLTNESLNPYSWFSAYLCYFFPLK